MPIQEITAYEYMGKMFTEQAKATEYAESLVAELLKKSLVSKGATVRETVKLTEAVLENRAALASLLNY